MSFLYLFLLSIFWIEFLIQNIFCIIFSFFFGTFLIKILFLYVFEFVRFLFCILFCYGLDSFIFLVKRIRFSISVFSFLYRRWVHVELGKNNRLRWYLNYLIPALLSFLCSLWPTGAGAVFEFKVTQQPTLPQIPRVLSFPWRISSTWMTPFNSIALLLFFILFSPKNTFIIDFVFQIVKDLFLTKILQVDFLFWNLYILPKIVN